MALAVWEVTWNRGERLCCCLLGAGEDFAVVRLVVDCLDGLRGCCFLRSGFFGFGRGCFGRCGPGCFLLDILADFGLGMRVSEERSRVLRSLLAFC